MEQPCVFQNEINGPCKGKMDTEPTLSETYDNFFQSPADDRWLLQLHFIDFADIEECVTGNHNCSPKAMCGNVPGSFLCNCKTGYTGDGVNCTGMSELLIHLSFSIPL